MLAEGRRVIVGTHDGLVAILDTESRDLLACYNWHEDKVRSLLILPEEIRRSICAEVDINLKEDDSLGTALPVNSSSPISHPTNGLFVPNTLVNQPLIASIGNGRHKMNTRRNQRNSRPRANTRASGADQDITLLLWHS